MNNNSEMSSRMIPGVGLREGIYNSPAVLLV